MTTITEAEGFVDLSMWEDAWDILESLPHARGNGFKALRLRMNCCEHLHQWSMGFHIAVMLGEGSARDRHDAARFLHLLATRRAADDDLDGAVLALVTAASMCPAYRRSLLEDSDLSEFI
ncbi:hypothetical protein OJ996_05030 [Luteolibacter sp. GHJ8]|uniref:HEPN domain-containing protein n=1 Tax=Luteolibacter rhizosphaerae TaxID=2989719 RepID=A0ABT3G016_9BACT|nr:hypothetical protein [Luteolibacter rhizosphaerae]MCW1912924.1 hypothetical protein [Luteolibacter rhizosphaerae]